MTDPVILSLNEGNGERERLGVYDDFAATGHPSADFVPGLVNLGFIKAAIFRSAWFVSFLAAVGLFGGLGVYVKYPHSYQASASLLVTLSPYEDNQSASTNNQAMAQTSSVAALAMRKLGVQQSTSSFLSTYTVSSATPRVLYIIASGPSAEPGSASGKCRGQCLPHVPCEGADCAAEPRGSVARPADQPGQATCQFACHADRPALEPARFTRAAVASRQAPSGTTPVRKTRCPASSKLSLATSRLPCRP